MYYFIKLNKDPMIYVRDLQDDKIVRHDVGSIDTSLYYSDNMLSIPATSEQTSENMKKFIYKIAANLKMKVINIK